MTRRAQAGFTLVEILIVAALMALLAGIAAINIQRAYVDNQRKSTYGEAANVRTALVFAYEDIGLYPKLCFLQHQILYLAPSQVSPYIQPGDQLVSGFEYMGYDVNQPITLVQRITKNWAKGMGSPGYFAAGQGRRGVSQGRRGGMVRVQIPVNIYPNPLKPPSEPDYAYDWPADPWGNPYVVYMLYLAAGRRIVNNQPTDLPDVRFVDSYSRQANYTLAVVSYGPNGIPGGREDYDAATLNTGIALRLFERSTLPGVQFRALIPPVQPYDPNDQSPNRYHQARCDVWSYTKLLGMPGPLAYPGVIDEGSDDIVVEF